MNRFIEWTPFEIEQMKVSFLQGKTIKDMAKQLGRTPTALNKALSRFGVRQRVHRSSKITLEPSVDWRCYLIPENKSVSLDDEPILIPSSPKTKNLIRRDHFKMTDPCWVPLGKVIRYLERQGYQVRKTNADLDDYQVDNEPAKASYLLLLANRLRVEEKKPIFMVSEVTW